MAVNDDASVNGDASIAEDVAGSAIPQAGTNELPSISFRESGYNGLTTLGGSVFEECSHELRWPQAIDTYKKMAKDGAIAPALELVEMMISRVPWSVKIPEGYETELKGKARYLEQVMGDMEHDWQSMIKQAATANRYGFSVIEKVYGYRRKAEGSKYDDGLVRIRKLPIRSQDTIDGWYWKNNGRDLAGLVQRVIVPDNATDNTGSGWDFVNTTASGVQPILKKIPRKKFLLFRNNPLKDSPIGIPSLHGCWMAWKYKTAFQESEAISVAQDANGFKVLYLPPQYMSKDATEEDQAVFSEYQKIMSNMHQAKQSGIILPLITDDTGNKMFEFEIKSVTGQKSHDINAIINRYNAEILTCLFADFLSLGNGGSGSFSLAESKLSVIEMAIQSKLDEIKAQLNHDLVTQLFSLNGWDTDVMPEFTYGNVSKESLDEISKFIQRTAAVATFPRNRDTINWVMKQADIPYRVPDTMTQEELDTALGNVTSNSGEGMVEGMSNGVGNSVGNSGDSSVSNSENS
ncbi:MAG: putative portal protein [Prokaryotic dsDNA virus sp.]|nr:MAG: putative portal protein [Prokaryotic dsDNA virus sp.]|tara:strand:+ start:20061 stop:21617 length:1557 start_codon:yes stop_codon:yes gene_type:complete